MLIKTPPVTVAPFDSPYLGQADYQCTGIDDYIKLQQAMDETNKGNILCLAGEYHLGGTITVKDGRRLTFEKGNSIIPGSSDAFVIERNAELFGAYFITWEECNGNLIRLDGSQQFSPYFSTKVSDIRVYDNYGKGTAILFQANNDGDFVWGVEVSNIRISGMEYAIRLKQEATGWVNGNAFYNVHGAESKRFIHTEVTNPSPMYIAGNDFSMVQYQATVGKSLSALKISGEYNHIQAMIWDWHEIGGKAVTFTENSKDNLLDIAVDPEYIEDLGTHNFIINRIGEHLQLDTLRLKKGLVVGDMG